MHSMTRSIVTVSSIAVIIASFFVYAREYSTSASSRTTTIEPNRKFPDDFLFGAATSAIQVEGAWNTDGKGPNIWDTFTHEHPEKIDGGASMNVTADSYRFYKKDVEALKQMGMNHYRFSISWTRILPDGTLASKNQAGIDYYNNLIDTLLANGIQPVVTLFHFDVPQSLQNLGGFTNEAIVDYFEDYADLAFKSFGDRVKTWIIFNEPSIFCSYFYGAGWLSPVIKTLPGISEYLCGHNALKANAVAYRLYQKRYASRFGGQLGVSLNANFYYSDTNNDDDVKRALEFEIGWLANPIFSDEGDYPTLILDQIEKNSMREGRRRSRLPKFSAHWINQIRGSADFLGLNYYTSRVVEPLAPAISPKASYENDVGLNQTVRPEWKKGNSFFLYSVPAGLGDLLRYIKTQYNNPRVFITENGWSDKGEGNDEERIDFIRDHLHEVVKAINDDGCNVFGYTAWSLIDTFEFFFGYGPKFGLYSVNFTSPLKERTPKASARFMTKLIATRKLPDKLKKVEQNFVE